MAHNAPQVPQPTAHYPGHSHADMRRQAMDGNDPGAAGEIAAEWKSIASELTEMAVGINTVVNGLRAGWTGTAGAAASQALTKVGNFTDQLSGSFTATSGVVDRQVEAAETTKNKFPQEVPGSPLQILKDGVTSLNPLKMAAAPFEAIAHHEKSQAAKQEAARVMQDRDDAMVAAAASMPVFEDTPQVTNTQQGVTTTSSTNFGHSTNSVNPSTQFGNPGFSTPGTNNGTTNTSWAAPSVTQPATPPGNVPIGRTPDERRPFGPGSGPVMPGLRPNPNDPRTTGRGGAGQSGPGGSAGRGGAGAGRGAGGFGPANPGATAGRGTFGPANPGGAAGVGHGPEGTTARGGGAGAAGKSGAAGMAGGAGAGAGKGGEEDKEHKSNYLIPTDEYFDDNRMVAPPVIGG